MIVVVNLFLLGATLFLIQMAWVMGKVTLSLSHKVHLSKSSPDILGPVILWKIPQKLPGGLYIPIFKKIFTEDVI